MTESKPRAVEVGTRVAVKHDGRSKHGTVAAIREAPFPGEIDVDIDAADGGGTITVPVGIDYE